MYALMHDAVVLSGRAISRMIENNQWNSTYGDLLQSGAQKAQRSTKFIEVFKTVYKFYMLLDLLI